MLKVLISDDELNVCNLLHSLIDWDGLRLTPVGITANGDEACRMALAHKPDIIITDIRMPVIDGLEMIRLVKEQGLEAKFVIISGYHSFDYAHQAIKYGVSDFLTKPINGEELHNTLLRLCREILENRQNDQARAELEMLNQRIANLAQSLRHQYMLDLFVNEGEVETGLEAVNREAMFRFAPGLFRVAVAHLDLQDADDAYYKTILSQMAKILRDDLPLCCNEVEVLEREKNLLVFMNYAPGRQQEVESRLASGYNHLREVIKPYPFYALTLGVGTAQPGLQQARDSLRQAAMCLASRLVLGTGQSIYFGQIAGREQPALPAGQGEWDTVAKGLALRNCEQALQGLRALFALGKPVLGEAPYLAEQWYAAIFDRLAAMVLEEGFPSPQGLVATGRRALENEADLAGLEGVCTQLVLGCFAQYDKELQKSDSHTIHVAKQYIAENYQDKLELETVARQVYLSPAYFGILFKRETGQNFTDYLIGLRVEKAKALLAQGGQSIAWVSASVGYRDTRHFIKLFKREVGVTPAEYRKIQHFS